MCTTSLLGCGLSVRDEHRAVDWTIISNETRRARKVECKRQCNHVTKKLIKLGFSNVLV